MKSEVQTMNMKHSLTVFSLACLAGISHAEGTIETASAGTFSFSANVALTSDYVWRGVSQSDEKGAIQGGFDVNHSSGLYAGIWGSNVDFNEGSSGAGDPSMELDLYGGFAHEFRSGMGIDIGLINYRYPGDDDLNWVEYYGGLSYSVMGLGLSGSINYSDDVFGADETGIYYTAGAEYGIETKYPITLSGSFGYYSFDDDVFGNDAPDSYKDWKLGAAVAVGNFTFDLSYVDTDNDGEDLFGSWADDRFVATLSAAF